MQHLDTAVNPRTPDARTGTVDEHAGFAIVQRTNDAICPAKPAEAKVGKDISNHRSSFHSIENMPSGASGAIGFELSLVRFAKQHRSAQVAQLDAIHVHNHDVANPKQGEILNDFITQSSADNQYFVRESNASSHHSMASRRENLPSAIRNSSGVAAGLTTGTVFASAEFMGFRFNYSRRLSLAANAIHHR